MIERLQFNDSGRDPHPFTSSSPLKITFHTQSLKDLTGDELIAFELLQELSRLPDIEALQTELGIFPHIEFEAFEYKRRNFKLVDRNGQIILTAGVYFPYNQNDLLEQFVKPDGSYPDAEKLIQDIVVADAHHVLGQHILVTTSPNLLDHRNDEFVGKSNPRTPSEAAKIIGLFLRSRGIFSIPKGKISISFPRSNFYSKLTDHHLPDMWAYFSACVDAGLILKDDTLDLGQSILIRCDRAMQARDAIGAQFYAPQDNDTRDTMMYHFDYLTLLLVGAFDAQARIAHRAYRLEKLLKEKQISLTRQNDNKFLDGLGKPPNAVAVKLYDIWTGNDFESIKTLLFGLRNTIHSAGLGSRAVGTSSQSMNDLSFVDVPTDNAIDIWKAAQQLQGLEYWGLVKDNGSVMFEPYTYASALIHECFKLINQIASATDVAGLFPYVVNIPPMRTKPLDDDIWSESIAKWFVILG
jgi:hypothetical protein